MAVKAVYERSQCWILSPLRRRIVNAKAVVGCRTAKPNGSGDKGTDVGASARLGSDMVSWSRKLFSFDV